MKEGKVRRPSSSIKAFFPPLCLPFKKIRFLCSRLSNSQLPAAIGYQSGRARLRWSNKVQNLSKSTTKCFLTTILHIQVVLQGAFTSGSLWDSRWWKHHLDKMLIKAMGKGHWESHMSTKNIFFSWKWQKLLSHTFLWPNKSFICSQLTMYPKGGVL